MIAAAQSDQILDDVGAMADVTASAFLRAVWLAGAIWGEQITE